MLGQATPGYGSCRYLGAGCRMLKPTHRLKIAFLYSIKCTIGGSSDGQSKNHFGDAVMDPAEKQLKAWRQFWVSETNCRSFYSLIRILFSISHGSAYSGLIISSSAY